MFQEPAAIDALEHPFEVNTRILDSEYDNSLIGLTLFELGLVGVEPLVGGALPVLGRELYGIELRLAVRDIDVGSHQKLGIGSQPRLLEGAVLPEADKESVKILGDVLCF